MDFWKNGICYCIKLHGHIQNKVIIHTPAQNISVVGLNLRLYVSGAMNHGFISPTLNLGLPKHIWERCPIPMIFATETGMTC